MDPSPCFVYVPSSQWSKCCGLTRHSRVSTQQVFCQEFLPIENSDSDLNVHAVHYANEVLVRVRLSFQKLLQTHSACRSKTHSLSIRVQATINHISICFLPQYQCQRNVFSERELKKALRDTLTQAAWYRQRPMS